MVATGKCDVIQVAVHRIHFNMLISARFTYILIINLVHHHHRHKHSHSNSSQMVFALYSTASYTLKSTEKVDVCSSALPLLLTDFFLVLSSSSSSSSVLLISSLSSSTLEHTSWKGRGRGKMRKMLYKDHRP